MINKALFIIIFIFQAALYGAAQVDIVIYEGATTNNFVEKHPGSSYAWGVYSSFSPTIEAPPDDYEIIGPANMDNIRIRWLNAGIYYLKITETDMTGCENLKVSPVKVISSTRTIGFLTTYAGSCFNPEGNGFKIPLITKDNDGKSLIAEYFPLVVEFIINNVGYSQEVTFDNQVIQIPNNWLNSYSQSKFNANVEIIAARDFNNEDLLPDANMKTHVREILALPHIEFENLISIVEQGALVTHKIKMVTGNPENSVYSWKLDQINGSTTDLCLNTSGIATVKWDGQPGLYNLIVNVSDGNGCVSETITQQIQIAEPSAFVVNAGRDTTLGSCDTYQLQALVEQQPGISYTYNWQPADNLDNPDIPNPIFTPGNTTTFVVKVTNKKGVSVTDTINIAVTNLIANAGNDIYMEQNETVILDGSNSGGEGLQYQWFTFSGKIESGKNSANPIVSEPGAYYLEITDAFGCTATDSVKVNILTHAPVANDDYDTTRYRTEIKIQVLNNDSDKDNSIVPSTLTISTSPVNGTAYVDFDDYTLHYRPNKSFSGTDNFEYKICNIYNECDRANVYVLVTDFKFLVPNAFSPNGDGINDYFEILGIENYEGNSLTIINRWGNKVYEAKNYGISTTPKFWDGKANSGIRIGNEELPTGTYYYILELGNGEKSIGGSIYLDR